MLNYFKKGKTTTEKENQSFEQCMEKVLRLIKHARSGLLRFPLEASCWVVPRGGVDRLKLTPLQSRSQLRTVSVTLRVR